MRVVLIGTPRARARLLGELTDRGVEIAGEFETLAQARAAHLEADAFLLADSGTEAPASPSSQAHWTAVDEALTPRETEVLELMAEGLPNKAIATRLGISDQTVKFHVASIIGKLGVSTRTAAVRRALRRGLISM